MSITRKIITLILALLVIGLNLLVKMFFLSLEGERRMRELGGRVWVENPARQPRRVIDASGVDRLVPVAMTKL